MAWAWLDHFDHTAYMSFQFVGFSSSLNVALRFRCPRLLQVSIKANPFVLFLVCLHLFVYLLCLILSGTLQLCTLLAYFPFPVSCVHSCQHKLHSFILVCTNALCYFWVLGACWLPSERGNDLSESAFISKWSDMMWDCGNHSARGVQCSLKLWGIAAWSLLSLLSQNYKDSADRLSSFPHLWVKQLVFKHKDMGFIDWHKCNYIKSFFMEPIWVLILFDRDCTIAKTHLWWLNYIVLKTCDIWMKPFSCSPCDHKFTESTFTFN